jgi:exopolysaccharide production protein ExoZ
MSKLAGVEAARGLAALLVVLVHATGMLADPKYLGEYPLAGLFKFGHAGVDFFFVLSGFIIYFIHADELGRSQYLKAYWLKRFIRLMPVYWVVLAMFGLLLVISPTKDLYERDPIAIVTNILLIPQSHGPILGVAWSLSHEILFYLLFSTLFISKTIGRILFSCWFLMIVFNVVTQYFQDWFWGGFVFRIFNAEFFFGLFVAHALRYWPIRFPATFFSLGTLLFLGTGVYESWGPFHPAEWPPRHLAYATGAAMVLYGLVGLENRGRLKLPKIASMLGEASYSIYLLHVIFIMLLQQLYLVSKKYIQMPDAGIFVIMVVISVAGGLVFSKIIEQPLLRYLRHRLIPKNREIAAAT